MWAAGFIWSYISTVVGTILLVIVALAANQWYKAKAVHTGFDKVVWVLSIANAVICGVFLLLM